MPPNVGALPGFRDFYPEEMAQRTHITNAWREVARRYAFVEYDGPPLESLDLYTKKSGDEIVGQLYTFEDKGERQVALRPEMTPSLARMVAARANALPKPIRWFSIPQLFRYERQQKGRLREHFQLNVDILGEESVAADAELLAVAIDVLRELGLTAADVRARVSDRRLLQSMILDAGIKADALPAVYVIIDKVGREPKDVTLEKLAKVSDDKIAKRLLEFITSPTTSAELLGGEHGERMRDYFAYLKALGVSDWVELDLSIVRGLDYYTGIVFELFDRKGEFRAICGGGRYDDLLGAIGGQNLPALGFGMGDVVLLELLKARGLVPPLTKTIDYWVAGGEDTPLADVMSVAATLRKQGKSAEYSLKSQKLARQLKSAAAAGASEVIIMQGAGGDDSPLVIRRLSDGEERRTTRKEFLASL